MTIGKNKNIKKPTKQLGASPHNSQAIGNIPTNIDIININNVRMINFTVDNISNKIIRGNNTILPKIRHGPS